MTDAAAGTLIRNHEEMVEYFRARKAELQLSDAFIDHIGGLTPGHTNKILGPSRNKRLGGFTIDIFLEVLACSFIPVSDPDKLRRMEARYEGRDETRVHYPEHRVSKQAVERAKPLILRQLASNGGRKRAERLPAKRRSEIARKGARATNRKRRQAKRVDGLAASSQNTTSLNR